MKFQYTSSFNVLTLTRDLNLRSLYPNTNVLPQSYDRYKTFIQVSI
ncbi:Uncharacterized protein APZ42_030216 [Daphnia magna]|uniref:Uncharacterized protein n=1 Tax=Daphnia magna TaxID=35525 RepID=A0A164NYS4_9CRUS|nr:Uncharacterized protein APZ42_030216 [Daphnia magna]